MGSNWTNPQINQLPLQFFIPKKLASFEGMSLSPFHSSNSLHYSLIFLSYLNTKLLHLNIHINTTQHNQPHKHAHTETKVHVFYLYGLGFVICGSPRLFFCGHTPIAIHSSIINILSLSLSMTNTKT